MGVKAPYEVTSFEILTFTFLSKSTQNEKLMAYAKYSYDALRKRIYIREVGSYANKTFQFNSLLLYKQVNILK